MSSAYVSYFRVAPIMARVPALSADDKTLRPVELVAPLPQQLQPTDAGVGAPAAGQRRRGQ